MNTLTAAYATASPDGTTYTHYEFMAEPVAFDVGEGHVELGGRLVALKNGAIYQVFDRGLGPTFAGLWEGCTYHLVVRSWQ